LKSLDVRVVPVQVRPGAPLQSKTATLMVAVFVCLAIPYSSIVFRYDALNGIEPLVDRDKYIGG
ncbi:hypothetical protein, partial [Salinivibrio sp. EAGSL]|uniref:hypothetical protein n=1 Tax=Salinivibrio sp. EAGSL TaxID=2738468 RepID=UPI001C377B93